MPESASNPAAPQPPVRPPPPGDGWKTSGVSVIPANSLEEVTGAGMATEGMHRRLAIDTARAGAQKLWAGTVTIDAHAKTGPHHHAELESIIYVVSGKARMRWGERLEFVAEAGPGDFIYVPPWVPHQEINAHENDKLECVLVRSNGTAVAWPVPIEPAEKPENVRWVDKTHASLLGPEHTHEHSHEH